MEYMAGFCPTCGSASDEPRGRQQLRTKITRWKVRRAMQDLTILLFTAVFFGLAFLYVKACQKLR
jgi:hypothetical protein